MKEIIFYTICMIISIVIIAVIEESIIDKMKGEKEDEL